MSRDVIGFIFDAFIAAVMLFIVPVIWQSYEYDKIAQQNMATVTEEFAEAASNKGYIDKRSYNAFIKRLNAGGGTYDVEIVHTQLIHEPEYVGGAFTGNVLTYDEETYTGEILEELEAHGAYLMEIGDEIKVTVTPTSKSLGKSFMKMILGSRDEAFTSVSRAIAGCEMETYARYLR